MRNPFAEALSEIAAAFARAHEPALLPPPAAARRGGPAGARLAVRARGRRLEQSAASRATPSTRTSGGAPPKVRRRCGPVGSAAKLGTQPLTMTPGARRGGDQRRLVGAVGQAEPEVQPAGRDAVERAAAEVALDGAHEGVTALAQPDPQRLQVPPPAR